MFPEINNLTMHLKQSSLSLSMLRMSSYYVVIFLHHFYQAAVAIKISNLLISFCSFDLSCPILEKDIFIERLYIVFYYIT